MVVSTLTPDPTLDMSFKTFVWDLVAKPNPPDRQWSCGAHSWNWRMSAATIGTHLTAHPDTGSQGPLLGRSIPKRLFVITDSCGSPAQSRKASMWHLDDLFANR